MNFIDLFAGAGGLSEGFIRAGFTPLAHVEMDKNAALSLETRAAYHYLKNNNNLDTYWKYLKNEITRKELFEGIPQNISDCVINESIGQETLQSIFNRIDSLILGKKVDFIIGGPPCQAYSTIGRARDNKGMKGDQRNFLFRYYAKFLRKYQPRFFVFENVRGLLTAGKGEYFKRMRAAFFKEGYQTDFKVLSSQDFGVVQKRERVILVGWQTQIAFSYPKFEQCEPEITVGELLADLPEIECGAREKILPYKVEAADYVYKIGLRNGQNLVSLNYTHNNNERDLRIYKKVIETWRNNNRRLLYDELPTELQTHKNTKAFKDRFKVVGNDAISHTVVAHAGKDGHYYIKDDLLNIRSLSTRELARIQSFPDDFYFEGGMGSIYKQIGNAVPPLMAEGIARTIQTQINNGN